MIHPDFRYDDEAHEQYERQGYCILEHFLTDEALAMCRENMDRMIGQLHPDRRAEEIISAHQLGEEWISRLATEPKVLDMIERQIGPNILLWSTAVLAKPPRTGQPVPWHQDAPYWNISGPLAGAVWIPLDNVDEENGTMSVLPGWHTRGALARIVDEKELFNEAIDPQALPADVESLKVTYRLRAGQMATHHTMIPHVSTPNHSERWRRLLILRYMSAAGTLGDKQYKDYRTMQPFGREFFLVRGQDVKRYGLRRL